MQICGCMIGLLASSVRAGRVDHSNLLIIMNTSKQINKDTTVDNTTTSVNKRKFADPSPARNLIKTLSTMLNMAGKQQIGIGSYAQVYKVYDKRDQTWKALRQIIKKGMAPHDLEQEKDINQRLMKIEHKNILRVYQILEDSQEIYYLVEYCEGGSLWDALNYIKGRRFSERQATMIVLDIARAIDILHQNGITHRDLKPQNILLTKEFGQGELPVIKLADFGLSTNKVLMETIAGTKEYIAPEQIKKEGGYTKAVDIWALGIIFDELIHGVPYFTGDKHQEVFNMIINKEYKARNDKIKGQTKALLINMLRKHPQERPLIAEVVERLEDIIEAFEFTQKKKKQSNASSSIKQPKQEGSPEKTQPYDPAQIKKQIDEYSKAAIKEVFCQKHPTETKLYRRYQNQLTCRKCLENDKNIVSVEQYIKRLKLLNKQAREKLAELPELEQIQLGDITTIIRNDKLAKQFQTRKDQSTVAFNKLKTRFNFLNTSNPPFEKKQSLDRCREELREYTHDNSRTLSSCTEFLMATVDMKLQRFLDKLFKEIQ